MIAIIKHIGCEGPGTLGEFLKTAGLTAKIIELGKGEHLPPADECDAVVLLGGPMNVYEEDKYPFLKEEDEFVKEIIKKEIPFLGICLGGQILAKALNAKIKKAPEKEIGWYPVNLNYAAYDDPLFKNLYNELIVFQWHEDTFEIPEKCILLAESKTCKNQAFKYGKNAYGFQFHIEVTPQIIEKWVNEYAEDSATNINILKLRRNTHKENKIYIKQAKLIYVNFLKIIENSK
ncbi:MAG: type 1 glutamine amidotransferase [bacterium]|nr:type 1 glutamine amidotransferase [bacterium]